ncbi:hypothetical protein OJ963_15750 [Streptomyces sp. RS2]|uniref:hypothetical protein n=1 Tax=Streptomyces sp. RS2 TaxID=1451205 RepID=UPI0021F83F5D|nr:hypothetical protein [Streptomyces sp. RS2]MCW1095381.1 hypothetical protein [Streptomyces sp. RS2]
MRLRRSTTLTGTAAAGCLLLLAACGHGPAPAAEDAAAPTPVRAACCFGVSNCRAPGTSPREEP